MLAGQSGLDPSFHQLLAGARDGVDAGIQRLGDLAVTPAFAGLRRIGLQQDACLQYLANRDLALLDERVEQGNRISEWFQEPGEVTVVSACAHELATQRSFGGVLLHDVQRHVAQHGQIVWAVVETGSVLILVHGDIKPPMQSVFDTPVETDDLIAALGRQD